MYQNLLLKFLIHWKKRMEEKSKKKLVHQAITISLKVKDVKFKKQQIKNLKIKKKEININMVLSRKNFKN